MINDMKHTIMAKNGAHSMKGAMIADKDEIDATPMSKTSQLTARESIVVLDAVADDFEAARKFIDAEIHNKTLQTPMESCFKGDTFKGGSLPQIQ